MCKCMYNVQMVEPPWGVGGGRTGKGSVRGEQRIERVEGFWEGQ